MNVHMRRATCGQRRCSVLGRLCNSATSAQHGRHCTGTLLGPSSASLDCIEGSVCDSGGQGPTGNASVICKRLVSLAECWSAVRLGSQSGDRRQHVQMNVCGRMTVPEAPNQSCTYLYMPTLHMGQDRVRASIRCAVRRLLGPRQDLAKRDPEWNVAHWRCVIGGSAPPPLR